MVIALMSGPFSLVREVLQIIDPAKYPDKPLFIASLLAAFMLAMFLLWFDEYQGKKKAEKRLNDERPVLGINTEGAEGRKTWANSPVPVIFTIQHLSGRLPTSIHFDPIPSQQGKFSLHFDALPHVEHSPQRTPIGFEVLEVGAPQLSASDWEETRPHQKQLLGMFLDDSPAELVQLDYRLSVHFLDGTETRSQQLTLKFDRQRWRFSITPFV